MNGIYKKCGELKRHRVVFLMIGVVCMVTCFIVQPVLAVGPYVDNGDGTITDTATGLMWQKSDDGTRRTWQEAMDYADNLTFAGYSDWRLPTIDELRGLIVCDDGKKPEKDDYCGSYTSPTIDPVFECVSAGYWSATENEHGTGDAWYVSFYAGHVYWYYKSFHRYARVVRSGPSGSFGHLDPLVILLSASEASGHSPLTVSFSCTVTSDNPPFTFSYDFNDGNVSDQQNAVHTFTSPGTYNVSVTVTDAKGQSVQETETITVTERPNDLPTASILLNGPNSGPAPFTAEFTAQAADTDGSITAYTWNFGDGSPAETGSGFPGEKTHTYTSQGTYSLTLRVTDDQGGTAEATQTIIVTYANRPPTCSIIASAADGTAPLAVGFVAQGTDPEGGALSYAWNFGDNTFGDGASVSHTYTIPGTYTAILTATDTAGLTGTGQQIITVTGVTHPELIVNPSGVPNEGNAPLSVVLTSGIIGGVTPYTYTWDFGDGTATSTDANPRHVYAQPGTYTVTLTATDNVGQTTSESTLITVNASGITPPINPPSGIGKAIIIAGGGAHKQNTLFSITNEYCQLFSKYLKKRGYTDSDIIYMNPIAPVTDEGHMDTGNQDYKLFSPESELESAFTEAAQALSQNQQFVLYIHGHASPDSIKINNDYQLSSYELSRLLDKIPTGVQQIIIIDTCHSGSFLDDLSGVENRIVMTSSDADSLAWTAESWNFSKKLFHGIRLNKNIWDAFQETEEMILGNPAIFGDQRPQLDDTKDGIYSSIDGPRSSKIFIGKEGVSQAEPPVITRVHDVLVLQTDQSIATLWVKTSPSHEGIKRVTATLISPEFQLASYEGEQTQFIETTKIELLYNAAKDRHEIDHDFRDAGLWKIMYEAEGTEGDLSDVKFGEVNAKGVTLPVLLDTWTNRSIYTYGDELSLGVDINSQIECDLYAVMIYPDGVTLITIYYPEHFSMPFEVLPYLEDVEASSNRSISVLDKTISQAFSPGIYIFGVIATEPNVDVLLGEWVTLAYDLFEVR